MKVTEALREAWRDLRTGAGRAAVSALLLLVALGAVVGLRVSAVTGDVRAAAAWVASGAATTVQDAPGRIDGAACDALDGVDGTLGAGAFRRIEDGVELAALPASAVPAYETSPSAISVLDVAGTADTTGVYLSAEVADELAVRPGQDLVTRTGPVPIAGVYAWPDDGRDPDLGYAVLAPVALDGRPFDQCHVRAWPADPSLGRLVRGTVLPADGAEDAVRPTSGQLNPRLGATFEPQSSGLDLSIAAAAGVGLAIGAASVGRRRLAIAADRHVGIPTSMQLLGIVVQHVVWAGVAAVVVVAGAVVLTRGLPPSDALPIVHEAALLAALGVVGTVVGGALGVLLVRERSLHRYFRAR